DNKETKPASFLLARRLERKMDEAERKRLLYVAMTRARDYLVMFFERGGQDRISFKSWLKGSLNIDPTGALTAEGPNAIRGSSGIGKFTVSLADRNSIAADEKDLRAKLIGGASSSWKASDRSLDFSMVSPLRREELETHLNWQDVLRVTPAT